MKLNLTQKELKSLLEKDDLERFCKLVISRLESFKGINNPVSFVQTEQEILLHSAALNRLNKAKNEGCDPRSELILERTRIAKALIQLFKDLPDYFFDPELYKKPDPFILITKPSKELQPGIILKSLLFLFFISYSVFTFYLLSHTEYEPRQTGYLFSLNMLSGFIGVIYSIKHNKYLKCTILCMGIGQLLITVFMFFGELGKLEPTLTINLAIASIAFLLAYFFKSLPPQFPALSDQI